MRLYTTLPLVIGVASASSQKLLLPWQHNAAVPIHDVVSHKAAKTRQVADTLKRHLEDVPTGFGDDFNISDIFGGNGSDFDWGDLGLDFGDLDMNFCGGDEAIMEFYGSVQCTCTLKSGDLVLTDIATILANLNVIMETGVDLGFDCLTLAPECYQKECGTVQATCNMTLDFAAQQAESTMNCSTCVEYTNGDGVYPEGGIMEGQTLCASLELCLADVLATAMERDDSTMLDNSEDILCGCNATLNGKECTCSLCDNGMGIELDCGDVISACTDTGFEMQNGGTTNVTNAVTSFLPSFEKTSTGGGGSGTTSSAATFCATSFVLSGWMLALALA